MSYLFDSSLRNAIQNRLSTFSRKANHNPELRRAAVVIVLVKCPLMNQACFVLTRRPEKLNSHSGQYALPGGKLESGENEIEAAIREVKEEIHLSLSSDEVLGILDDYPTRSGFRITPVVVWSEFSQGMKKNPDEVAELFTIPLVELSQPQIPKLEHLEGLDHPVLSAPLPTLGHEVYAPTAAMLYQFREVCLLGKHTRVAHFEQPKFAWR